jgi:hypothetical protein
MQRLEASLVRAAIRPRSKGRMTIRSEIERWFKSGGIAPGIRGLLTYDPKAPPSEIPFSAARGQMDRDFYDLSLALRVLQEDPRVTLLPDGVSKYELRFVFRPAPEDIPVIWQKQCSYGTKHPMSKLYVALFDLDMLGLRAAGAAKYADFFGRQHDDIRTMCHGIGAALLRARGH